MLKEKSKTEIDDGLRSRKQIKTEEVKNERFVMWKRQDKLDIREGGSTSTLSLYRVLSLSVCPSITFLKAT